MPAVGKKKFSYTKSGEASAVKYAKETGKKVKRKVKREVKRKAY